MSKNKLISENDPNFVPPLNFNYLMRWSFDDPEKYQNYLRKIEELNDIVLDTKILKIVNKYFRSKNPIIPLFLLYSFSSNSDEKDLAKLKLVFHLTSEFGGPYSSLSVNSQKAGVMKRFPINFRLVPLGISLADIEIGYLILSERTNKEEFKKYQKKTDEYLKYQFFSRIDDEDKKILKEISNFIQVTPIYDFDIIKKFRTTPKLLTNNLQYIQRNIGTEKYSSIMNYVARMSKTKVHVDEFLDYLESGEYDQKTINQKTIRKYFKDNSIFQDWVIEYLNDWLVKNIIGLTRTQIRFWLVYYFTGEFGEPVKFISVNQFEKNLIYIYPFNDKVELNSKEIIKKYGTIGKVFVKWFQNSVYQNVQTPDILMKKIEIKNWLILGASAETDYHSWKKFVRTKGANITVFNRDEDPEEIPELISGDFNDVVDLNNLPEHEYDKIIFADSTVYFANWFGIHLSVLCRKLKKNGTLYIPLVNNVSAIYSKKFVDITKILENQKEQLMKSESTYLLFNGTLNGQSRRSEKDPNHKNPYLDDNYQIVYIGANRVELDTTSNGIKIAKKDGINVVKLNQKYKEIYENHNRTLFRRFFEKVELLDSGYPNPNIMKEKFWKLSIPKKRKISTEETFILQKNLNRKAEMSEPSDWTERTDN